MTINFASIDPTENPTLILRNLAGTAIGSLNMAYDISLDIKYNEVSTLDFKFPQTVDGVTLPAYDSLVGMKVIEVQDIGQFILVNPKEVSDGVQTYKECTAYSLEYEISFKKITITDGTYNFWNPVSQDDTVLGMILEELPSWSPGSIDDDLVGKYRTFSVSDESIYNFMKNTLQDSYSCIFEFDTFNRLINVRSTASDCATQPVYLSHNNLAKEIQVEEDTENLVTRLDVNGAEDVDIRDVNPDGTNKILNLDYFMTTDNFSEEIIEAYEAWKQTYEDSQQSYYNLSIDYGLQTIAYVTKTAELTDLQGELTSLENVLAVTIQSISEGLISNPTTALNEANADIAEKEAEIEEKQAEIDAIQEEMDEIYSELQQMNEDCTFKNYLTDDEWELVNRYIMDDSVTESSFVVSSTESYSDDYYGVDATGLYINISDGDVTKVTTSTSKTIYDISGGTLEIASKSISATIIDAAVEVKSDGSVILSAYLSKPTVDDTDYATGCLSITGTCGTVNSDATYNSVYGMYYGSTCRFSMTSGYLYFTVNATEYQKRAVAWELYEYGADVLSKVSQPTYKFSVSAANFLSLEEFNVFRRELTLGDKIYVALSEDETLEPIVVGVSIDYDNPEDLSLEFSDTYLSGDSAFQLADLLESSISLGKSVDYSKYTYSAFIDSGANTSVKAFMESAIDVAVNAIISTNEQAITWGDSGIRLRKWADDEHTYYADEQIWMNNNSIMMTDDNWASAEIAIGKFYDENVGTVWGIIAPYVVGTLVAGSNLVIESAKTDGSVSVFRVDADGCYLHNCEMSVTCDANNTQILLDPEHGLVIGTYPVIDEDGNVNEDNYKFYADDSGNLHLTGTIYATAGKIGGFTIGSSAIYSNGKTSYNSTTTGVYLGTDGIGLGAGTFYVTSAGYMYAKNGTFSGTLSAASGTFTGSLEAASGTFTGSLQAASGTFTGSLQAATGSFSGSITASSGTIGGFTIGSSSIYNGLTSVTGTTSGVYLGTDGIATSSGVYTSSMRDGRIYFYYYGSLDGYISGESYYSNVGSYGLRISGNHVMLLGTYIGTGAYTAPGYTSTIYTGKGTTCYLTAYDGSTTILTFTNGLLTSASGEVVVL